MSKITIDVEEKMFGKAAKDKIESLNKQIDSLRKQIYKLKDKIALYRNNIYALKNLRRSAKLIVAKIGKVIDFIDCD